MNKIELLAPAKNFETAIAAINSGADAIYIGASDFGARVNARNSLGDLKNLVDYAHKFYVKVHVTINTILNDLELEKAIELVKSLYNIGVDAIIVQDFGLLEAAANGKLPPIQIHASTQCDNRTLDKVKFFDNVGISRVILARELTLEQIENICKNVTCEIETFIHGALCVCYSGQCYLSYANGGRSANRGECAQPCRKKYSLVTSDGKVLLSSQYLLSMKDFNASEHLKKLINFGVNSFKIEGRLKDLNYVKNIVLYYNNLLAEFERSSSGKVFTNFVPNINKTFNRSYTDYFLFGRKTCYNFISPKFMGEELGKIVKISKNYFEIDADLHAQDGICFISNGNINGFLINKVEKNRVYPNKMSGLKVGMTLYRNQDFDFEMSLKSAVVVRKIGVSIVVEDNNISAIDEDNNIVTILLPSGEIPNNPEKLRNIYVKQLSKLGESDFYLQKIAVNQDILPFLPVSTINDLRRKLLNLLIKRRLSNYKINPQKPIKYAKFPNDKMSYNANVYNKLAKSFYSKCSCEILEPALETLTNIPSGVELMRTKHCLKFAMNLCQKKTPLLYLQDENGKKYPLKFDCKNCEMVIMNP
ncbi:U32 family peptidase [bacterium]|nr:U32 family peptidase [bacterium]